MHLLPDEPRFFSACPERQPWADADELDKLLTRQAELKTLVRKYAPDIDGVIAWHTSAQARLAEIDDPQLWIARVL